MGPRHAYIHTYAYILRHAYIHTYVSWSLRSLSLLLNPRPPLYTLVIAFALRSYTARAHALSLLITVLSSGHCSTRFIGISLQLLTVCRLCLSAVQLLYNEQVSRGERHFTARGAETIKRYIGKALSGWGCLARDAGGGVENGGWALKMANGFGASESGEWVGLCRC